MRFNLDEAQRLAVRMGANLHTGIVGQDQLVDGLMLALHEWEIGVSPFPYF